MPSFEPKHFLSQQIFSLAPAAIWELFCRVDPMRLGRGGQVEWIRGQEMACLREFEHGPLVRVWAGIELEPAGQGTRVRAFAEITARSRWIVPFVSWIGTHLVQSVMRCCRKES